MNTIAWLENAWRDLTYGARLLRLNPGFAGVAVLSLALGVGANTAMFQLLDAVRLRTLPVKEPQRLVEMRIAETPRGRTGSFLGRRPMLTNHRNLELGIWNSECVHEAANLRTHSAFRRFLA